MSAILAMGSVEIGAHFHSWTRKWPFPVPDLGNPPLHASVQHLGQEVEERMLEYTCSAIASSFGTRPVCYRGGRWSLTGASLRSLRNCGIKTDSTITPGISWAEGEHPWLYSPDFRMAKQSPFFLAGESLEPREHGEILELPVGTAFIPDRKTALSRSVAARICRKACYLLGQPCGVIWLRPTLYSRTEMRECLRRLYESRVAVWVSMIHSSEIIPCKYFATEREVRKFRDRCLYLIRDAEELGAKAATLTDVWKQYAEVCGAN
jgi:hypothetical protein